MRLTKKQVYDLRKLIERGYCMKPSKACEKCVVNTCRDGMWFMTGSETTSLEAKELSKAERLLKQHYTTIAEDIFLKGDI